jgi:transposase-like protein
MSTAWCPMFSFSGTEAAKTFLTRLLGECDAPEFIYTDRLRSRATAQLAVGGTYGNSVVWWPRLIWRPPLIARARRSTVSQVRRWTACMPSR